MSKQGTGIEWTDVTWNPVTGCDTVSPGCDHCYARTLSRRLKAMGAARYQNDGDPITSGPGFKSTMHPELIRQPLSWRKPRMVFVNSMSDLFHKDVTDDFIAEVWAVMSMTPQHTYQVLTKRHGRLRSLLSSGIFRLMVNAARLRRGVPVLPDSRRPDGTYAWPLPNVWVGVSAENQQWADIRIPFLLDTPAAVRFVSAEPLLGPISFRWANWAPLLNSNHLDGMRGLDWVIVGGESGPNHRPIEADWVRTIRDQCAVADVAFFFKQWGGARPKSGGKELDGRVHADWPSGGVGMTTIADQSDIAPFPWWVWLLAAAFLVTVATIRTIRRAPLQPAEPSRLDTLDRVGVEPCSTRRPHRMLPTEYGWRCANDCGERWDIAADDDLATADLALWELDMGRVE